MMANVKQKLSDAFNDSEAKSTKSIAEEKASSNRQTVRIPDRS